MKTWFDWMEQYHLPCPQADGAQDGESERILTLTRSKLGLQETAPKGSAAAARPTVRRTLPLRWCSASALEPLPPVCIHGMPWRISLVQTGSRPRGWACPARGWR